MCGFDSRPRQPKFLNEIKDFLTAAPRGRFRGSLCSPSARPHKRCSPCYRLSLAGAFTFAGVTAPGVVPSRVPRRPCRYDRSRGATAHRVRQVSWRWCAGPLSSSAGRRRTRTPAGRTTPALGLLRAAQLSTAERIERVDRRFRPGTLGNGGSKDGHLTGVQTPEYSGGVGRSGVCRIPFSRLIE
jgi:hypothetical protein